MIQRIQSLYLLVALLVTGSLLFTNMLYLETTTASMALRQNGLFEVTGNADLIGRTMPLQLMLTVTLLLLLVTIFLFKNVSFNSASVALIWPCMPDYRF